MTEEGIDAGGKAGMSRKLVAGIIVAVVVAAGVGAVVWWNSQDGGANTSYDLTLYFDTQYSESEWIVTLVNVTTNTRNYNIDPNTTHYETGTSELVDRDSFYNIRNSPSPYGIRWHDANNDNLVNVGDYLTINRSGGSGGKLEAHKHILFNTDYGYSPYIHLPPAEFLEMDVVKTATGWNMTVTWVNGTVPAGFMSGGNVRFRVEDNNGEFFGGRPGVDVNMVPKEYWRTSLGLIDHSIRNLSNINYNYYYVQGSYNITWFDNDGDHNLSVNDSIIIENHSNLIERDYKFRLMCEKYGWMHTIYEVTFNE